MTWTSVCDRQCRCGVRASLLLIALVLGAALLAGRALASKDLAAGPMAEGMGTARAFAQGGSPMELKSESFAPEGAIPPAYTCDGMDISPPLAWQGAPQAAQSFALLCDDPDAPGGTWVHWVLYDIPPGVNRIPENVPASEHVPDVGTQGRNDFRRIGYGGPCPPGGTHRYHFRLYALDCELKARPGLTRGELLKKMQGHVLAEAVLMGTYRRR